MTNVRVVDESGTEGLLPVARLPYWEAKGKGFKAVDEDEVKLARETDGIDEDQVKVASERAKAQQEQKTGTAAKSAETTRGRASGGTSTS